MLQKGTGVGNNNSKGEDCVSVRKEDSVIIHNTRNYLSTGEATIVENKAPEQDTSVPVDYTNSETEMAYDYGEDD